MAVINWDFLSKDWDVISQAPATFSIALILSLIALGGLIVWILEREYRGKLNKREGEISLFKQQLEAERSEFSRQLSRRDEEILDLKNKAGIALEAPENNPSPRVNRLEQYKAQLKQHSNAELAREARQTLKRLRSLVDTVLLYQRAGRIQTVEGQSNHAQETHLYNTWLEEGPKLLAIKREIMKRLPDDIADRVDRYPDSYYQSPTMAAELMSQAMAEMVEFGSEIKKIA